MPRPRRFRSAMRAPRNSAASTAGCLVRRRYAISRPCVTWRAVRASKYCVRQLGVHCTGLPLASLRRRILATFFCGAVLRVPGARGQHTTISTCVVQEEANVGRRPHRCGTHIAHVVHVDRRVAPRHGVCCHTASPPGNGRCLPTLSSCVIVATHVSCPGHLPSAICTRGSAGHHLRKATLNEKEEQACARIP